MSRESSEIFINQYGSESPVKSTIIEKPSYLVAKRCLDILGAFLGLVCLLPLFMVVSIFIKIEGRNGPVLFKQTRIGKNGKEFQMYKFRSMVTNAEELLDSLMHRNETTGAMFKMKEDPRVTKIGKLIRKTSIDELPQLWNVLKGEMSLVGPRPPLLREVQQYSDYDKQRLKVSPGCTGLWQVTGRSSIGFEKMIELDLIYISERGFWFDTKLIFKTICLLFNPKGGAY